MSISIDDIKQEIREVLYATGIPNNDNEDISPPWNLNHQKNYPDRIEYEFETSGIIVKVIQDLNSDELTIKDTRPWGFVFDDYDWSPGDPHYIYFKLINGYNEYGGCPEMTFDIPDGIMEYESENSYSMNENKFKTKQDIINYFAAKGVRYIGDDCYD